jgi:hypothetical protein
MNIDKFYPNPILININKLKPYKFVEDHIFQHVMVKPNDSLPKELVETNYYGDLFIKKPIESHTKNMGVNKPVEKRINYNLSNQ